MKCVILAAGEGKRLRPYSTVAPKALIRLSNRRTLLGINLERIKASGLANNVLIVAGYKKEKIKEFVKNLKNSLDLKIRIISNKNYYLGGPLISILLAKKYINEDFIILNGDTIFSLNLFKEVKEKIKEKNNSAWIVVSKCSCRSTDEIQVKVKKGRVLKVGKNLSEDSSYVSAGFVVFKGEYRKKFLSLLAEEGKEQEFFNSFSTWHNFLNKIIAKTDIFISLIKVKREEWQEIDTILDIIQARALR